MKIILIFFKFWIFFAIFFPKNFQKSSFLQKIVIFFPKLRKILNQSKWKFIHIQIFIKNSINSLIFQNFLKFWVMFQKNPNFRLWLHQCIALEFFRQPISFLFQVSQSILFNLGALAFRKRCARSTLFSNPLARARPAPPLQLTGLFIILSAAQTLY